MPPTNDNQAKQVVCLGTASAAHVRGAGAQFQEALTVRYTYLQLSSPAISDTSGVCGMCMCSKQGACLHVQTNWLTMLKTYTHPCP